MRTLYTGPRLAPLERAAMEQLSGELSGGIDEALFIASDAARIPIIEDRWEAYGSPLQLQVTTLDSFVHECHERAFHETEFGHMDSTTRDRLVEVAVERLSGTTNPLAVDGLPARGLCDRADEMLTLMEFADLLETEAIADRLRAEGLDRQADIIATFHETFTAVRTEHAGARSGVGLSIRAERYSRLVAEQDSLADLRPATEQVILGGFTLFSPLERAVIERIVDTWPTAAILPRMTDGSVEGGIDRAVERIDREYRGMGLESEWIAPNEDAAGTGHAALGRQLFREQATGPERRLDSLAWYEAPTRPMELRFIARTIREELRDGRPPGDIGLVLASEESYRGLVESIFEQYDIPVTSGIDRPVLETALGRAVTEGATLVDGPARTGTLVALLSNPLVEPPAVPDSDRLVTALRDIDQRSDSDALDRALIALGERDETSDADVAAVESLLDTLESYRRTSLADLSDATETLLEQLGVDARLETLESGSRLAMLSRTARRQLLTTARKVAETAPLVDDGDVLPIERFRRALESVVIQRSPDRDADRVVVTSLTDVGVASFERVYLAGLTDSDFPSDPDRLAFTTPINEAHEDFAQADTTRRARYHAMVLLADADTVTLTTPSQALDGGPLVESDLLAELHRVTGIEPRPADSPPGTQEDVQREIARLPTAEDEAADARHEAVVAATERGPFDERMRDRAHDGIECAAARRSPMVGPYDGQLSPETRRELRDGDADAYAPTRLETYATCGFKDYMGELLDIDEPEQLQAEATALDRGSFIHDVLERFYLEIQDDLGDPVTTSVSDTDEWQAQLLTIALDELTDELATDPTPFQVGWLESVMAGLGDPAENPYHGSTAGDGEAVGMFRRFLQEEAVLDDVSVAPTWFEARFGPERPFDGTVLRDTPIPIDTPDGTVRLTGTVDRIDTDDVGDGIELVVRDYKSGRTPAEGDTLDGQTLQLPIYALLAEAVLGEELDRAVETVGGTYYQVRPPVDVSHNKGQIGSEERTAHARYGSGEPLLAWQYPRFETHAGFREFVEVETPRRLGRLAAAIEDGAFHPTILDPGDAGCEYCGYSHVCDVRSHQRHDVREALEGDAETTAYIPPIAHGGTYEPAVEQEGGD